MVNKPSLNPVLCVSKAVVTLGLTSLWASCTVLIDSGRQQCSADTDCTSRGPEFANYVCADTICAPTTPTPWGCLGKVTWPAAGTGTVVATLNLKDIVTYQPIPRVSARVCRKLDLTCAQPLATGLVSDDAGKLNIEAPSGFDGYVELLPNDAIPGIYFFYPPLSAPREVPFVPILPLAELSGFVQLTGTSMIPGRGQVVTAAYDCLRQPAEGVTFASPNADEQSKPFYMIKGMPSARVTATDGSGYGGILNLAPGSVNLTGLLATGQVIGTQSLLVRADQITYTTVLPMPE